MRFFHSLFNSPATLSLFRGCLKVIDTVRLFISNRIVMPALLGQDAVRFGHMPLQTAGDSAKSTGDPALR